MATTTSSLSSASGLSGSGTLSSAGLGSGLDVNGIVSKLMAIERQPIDKIDTQTGVVQAEITAYGSLKSALSTFQTSIQSLTNASTYSATKATASDSTQFTVTSDSTAGVGNYSIQVQKLAKAEKLQSAAFSSATDSVGTGTLTFDFGTYTTDSSGNTSFALNTNKKQVSVAIPSGSDSLTAIASAINNAKAGISATVLNDGTSSYLSFSPTDPGNANALRVSVSDADGNNSDAAGLSRLAFDKSTGLVQGSVDFTSASVNIAAASSNNKFTLALDGGASVNVTLADGTYNKTTIVAALQSAVDGALGSNKATVSLNASNNLVIASKTTSGFAGITLGQYPGNTGVTALFGNGGTSVSATNRMTESVAPQDAKLLIDGVTVTKSSNVITDAIQGMTLNLTAEGTSATTVAVTSDSSALSSAMDSLVKNYNSLASQFKTLMSYDATTGATGALQGEGTVRSIQQQISSMLQTVSKGLGVSSLSQLGVSFQRDGTLAFNSDKLQTALTDPTKNLKTFFIGTDGNSGFASRLDDALNSILGAGGMLSARTDGLNEQLTNYAKQKADLETRMTAIEARYRKQYSDLDTLIASMNSTSTYLTQQLANLPTIGSTTKSSG
ncbi:MAG: hypothetical protein EKK46_02155 [Rhodocyclaceae bacterium]|nr:MAG: hypothetical protein EKK46_02155 [Rhodocyclaceae bacterium]